jgi:hypothetical protein
MWEDYAATYEWISALDAKRLRLFVARFVTAYEDTIYQITSGRVSEIMVSKKVGAVVAHRKWESVSDISEVGELWGKMAAYSLLKTGEDGKRLRLSVI